MLFGTYTNNIDAKGRVFLPAKFREDLGTNLVLVKTSNNCLSLYSEQKWDAFCRQGLEKGGLSVSLQFRKLSTEAMTVEPDSQGRIIIPQKFREQLNLEGEAAFVGLYSRVEIWNNATLVEATKDISIDDAMQTLAELGM